MARQTTILASLNGGELTPLLEARTDYGQYNKGLRDCTNGLPLVQGPVDKRPGSRYVAATKYHDKKSYLKKFVFADDDAFTLEFGDQYIRFFAQRGQVLSGGVPLEIASPYAWQDIPLIRYVQSADIIYLAHPLYAPRKLVRNSATSWTLSVIDFENGPIGDENTDATTMQATAVTGTVTITASSGVFNADMIGGFIRLRHKSNGGVPPWKAGESVGANALRSYDGRFFAADAAGTTGGDPPIHTEDSALDGSPGVSWRYLHEGFGIARITGYTSPTVVTAVVTSRLPDGAVTAATPYWAFGDWNADYGYPGGVTFYGDRLYWGGSPKFPQRIWGSVVGDYENHKPGTEDDSALSLTLSASEVNTIRWMINDEKGLLVGTTRGEWVVRPSSQNEALTPFNAQATQASNLGSNYVAPVRVNRASMFLQSAGRKLRELAYTIDVDGFTAPDMTVRAEHITVGGVSSLAYQAQPDPLIWSTRSDGALLSFTYEREQEVLAWAKHWIGGYSDANETMPAVVESVEVIPSPEGDRDDLWMIVKRYINGGIKRYVEYLSPRFGHDAPQEDAIFVDCSAEYRGTPATVISGLSWLEGQTVRILVDGATHPDREVIGGSVTLDSPASVVQVGLPYKMTVNTQRLEAGVAANATPQAAKRRIIRTVFRVYRTGLFKYGPNINLLDEIDPRSTEDRMDYAPPLLTGDYAVTWPGGWDFDTSVVFISDNALPATVMAIMPTVEGSEP